MSQAFVKESDGEWLHDVGPSLNALIGYLTRENNGVRVYETRNYADPVSGVEVHAMSNGLDYRKNKDGVWEVV